MEVRDDQIATAPMDDVDFTSGFETQYKKEYRPLRANYIPPPDKKNAWYRDLKTIFMLTFLGAVLVIGSVLLVALVFTSNHVYIFFIVFTYVLVAAIIIYLEIKTIHVR